MRISNYNDSEAKRQWPSVAFEEQAIHMTRAQCTVGVESENSYDVFGGNFALHVLGASSCVFPFLDSGTRLMAVHLLYERLCSAVCGVADLFVRRRNCCENLRPNRVLGRCKECVSSILKT